MPTLTSEQARELRKKVKNPAGGRKRKPRQYEVEAQRLRELLEPHISAAVQALVEVLQDPDSSSAKIRAASEILDRYFGKAPQGVELTGKDGGPINFNDVLNWAKNPTSQGTAKK